MSHYLGKVQVGSTVSGISEWWPIQAARGDLSGLSVTNTFGLNPDVDAATAPEDIWNGGGDINYPATASVMNIASTSADDDAAGDNARVVLVAGLNANWDAVQELVPMDGTTIVTTTNSYIRINRIAVVQGGTAAVNGGAAGIIRIFTGTASSGIPDDLSLVYRQIDAEDTSSETMGFTTPRNVEAFINYGGVQLRAGGGSGAYVSFQFLLRVNINTDGLTMATDPVFRNLLSFISTRESPFSRDIPIPFRIPEGTDVKVRAVNASADNITCSGSLNYTLVQKRVEHDPVELS